mgnify:CR=1 FL=1
MPQFWYSSFSSNVLYSFDENFGYLLLNVTPRRKKVTMMVPNILVQILGVVDFIAVCLDSDLMVPRLDLNT